MSVTDGEIGRRVSVWRERRGLTQGQLAEQIAGLTQSKLSQIEAGSRRLASVELAELAGALRIDPLDLLEDEPLAEAVVAEARGGAGGLASDALEVAVDLLRTWRQLDADGFQVAVGSRPRPDQIPRHAVSEGRSAAETARAALGLGMGPVPELLGVCAQLGLVVLYRPFSASFDGVSASDGSHGVAVINTSEKWRGRQRFTLAHELGHWILGDIDDHPTVDENVYANDGGYKEKRANSFAANFLVPDAALAGASTLSDAVRLAYEYRVSLKTMAWRVKNARNDDALHQALIDARPFDAAQQAGCGEGFREDRDAIGRQGISEQFEAALVDAQELGAVSERRVASLIAVASD